MKTIADFLQEYTSKSRDPHYAGYSLLQCAAYDGDEAAAHALIDYYRVKNSLLFELSYVSPQGKTHENILHVAIKYPRICELFCHFISRTNPDLFTLHINQGDIDKDTVFHQAVAFGRSDSLKILMGYLHDLVADIDLDAAFKKTNKHGETASDIAENYATSATIIHLKQRGILTVENWGYAQSKLEKIQHIFSEQLAPRSPYSY